jgi:hypothetical protein
MQAYKFYRRKEDFRAKDGLTAMYLPATDEFPEHLVQGEWEFVGRALPPEGAPMKDVAHNAPIYRTCPPGINPKFFYSEI